MEYVTREYKHNRTARTASVLAFASLVSTFFLTVILPYLFAPLAIIFGVLSKGKTGSYSLQARIAFIVAAIALVLNTSLTAFATYNVFFNDNYRKQVDELWQEYYGMTFDEYKEALYNQLASPVELANPEINDVPTDPVQ